ncbi:hypothetical protein K491DRAFT_699544 [Lophiostoma macrostomum CBS 122681]|uniref:Uncharacterized protein n=1 Tax=Lophiostoma macrostomum CBS 122681 TaxID=1314788 RepID=A0A6A6SII9_9PLEO|nr:hypothetical protein K491DRAFT_699544 [Lophiostoma macrostomum CBS 122681]
MLQGVWALSSHPVLLYYGWMAAAAFDGRVVFCGLRMGFRTLSRRGRDGESTGIKLMQRDA